MKRPTWEIPLGKHIELYCLAPRYRFAKDKSNRGKKVKCTKTYEIVDSDRMGLRKGDIIKFDTYYCHAPKYAKGHMAVILERYRITKQKPIGVFRDYGAVLMMLGGKKKGRIFKKSSVFMGKSNKMIW